MTAYYNEYDPFAAAWLNQLIYEGHIAPGVVDTRSIVDVQPSDIRGAGNAVNVAQAAGFLRAIM